MTDLQWGRLSNDAFNVALFSYVAAMVGYFAFMAFRKAHSVGRRADGRDVRAVRQRGLRRDPRVRRPPRAVGATCTSTPCSWRSWSSSATW